MLKTQKTFTLVITYTVIGYPANRMKYLIHCMNSLIISHKMKDN